MSEARRYKSALSIPIKGYIAEKQAVGYAFKKGADLLKRFDSYVHSLCLTETVLSKQLVMGWTARKPNETISTQCGRISLLRGLAEYMTRVGYSAYVYPKAMVTINRYSYIPYIFSNNEVKRIFEVCDQDPPNSCAPNRHLILPLLLRMLYGCGLRISEAVQLTLQDVDLHNGSLHIRNAKFNKERILPMSESLEDDAVYIVKLSKLESWGTRISFLLRMADITLRQPCTSSLEKCSEVRAFHIWGEEKAPAFTIFGTPSPYIA